MNCPSCQTINPPGTRLCLKCGTALVQVCAHCQAELPLKAHFCMNCGKPVDHITQADDDLLALAGAATPVQLAQKVRASDYLVGERRIVTALFADVVDSTGMRAKIGPERMGEVINEALQRCYPVIYQHEGTFALVQNDTILAFFGAPLAHEDDPVRAVHAAMGLIEGARSFSEELEQKTGVSFLIRVGLSTGEVSIGPVDKNLRYTFIPLGYDVNLASRIQFYAPPMSIVATEETFRHIAPFVESSEFGSVQIEGQQEPVKIHKIEKIIAEPPENRGISGLGSPLVGRETEMETLLHLSDAVRAGLGRAVLVVGDTGVGKTRLINEWRSSVERSGGTPRLRWARGRRYSYAQSTTYHLLIDLLRSLLNIPSSADVQAATNILRSTVDALFEDDHDVFLYLAHLLFLPLDGESQELARLLDPQAIQAKYIAAIRKLIHKMAEREPLVLVLDDLHWADPSSVDLLTRLLALATQSPILFCLVTRPERETAGWKMISAVRETLGDSLSELHLMPLSDEENQQLLANLLGGRVLPEHIRSLVLSRSEGNPFFTEEMVRMLIARGILTETNGKWVASSELSREMIPDNLQSLMLAHIDRLPADAKETLRVASVIGRNFQLPLLEHVVGEKSVFQDISVLETAGMIRVTQVRPELTYSFRHALVHEAAYASLLAEDRQGLHSRVGDAIEHLYPTQSGAFAPRLAQHFFEAGDRRRALAYFRMAGEAALACYCNQEAESHFQIALELADNETEYVTLLDRLGEAYFEQGNYSQAMKTWREGMRLYRKREDNDAVARLYARSARAAWFAGDTPGSLTLCLEGLSQVNTDQESHGVAALLHETARAYYFNGQTKPCFELIQRALDMAERLGAVDVQADTLATLGLLHDQPSDRIITALTHAVELAVSHGLLATAARAHTNLGAAYIGLRGDLRTARNHYLKAAELHRQRGVATDELVARMYVADASFNLGELTAVEETLHSLEQLLENSRDTYSAEFALRVFEAKLLATKGEWLRAVQLLRNYREEARKRGDLHNLSEVCYTLGWVLMEMAVWELSADTQEAYDAFRETIDIADRGLTYNVSIYCLMCMLEIKRNNFESAQGYLEQARKNAGAQPIPLEESWLLWAQSILDTKQGRVDSGLNAIQSAVGAIIPVGLRWHWARQLIDWATAMSLRGEPQDIEQAQALLRQSQSMFEELGAMEYAHRAELYLKQLTSETIARAADQKKFARELAMAGRVQGGFLPVELPDIPGWQLAAILRPARQMSGDFYDFMILPDGKVGVLVGDVADKGMGAALFMTLSRTLIRTYAFEFKDHPEQVFDAANKRLLQDSRVGLFVTSFYLVLEPTSGKMTYTNAGHNPPYWIHPHDGAQITMLTRTGIPLGIFEDSQWEPVTLEIHPSDYVILYTDGLTEAQNEEGQFYSEERLIASIKKHAVTHPSAQTLLEQVLEDLHTFTGDIPNSDDLALVILHREP